MSDHSSRWTYGDSAYAGALTSDDEVFVEYDASPNEDGSKIVVRRTVWKKAYRTKYGYILYQEQSAELTRDQTVNLITQLVRSLEVQ